MNWNLKITAGLQDVVNIKKHVVIAWHRVSTSLELVHLRTTTENLLLKLLNKPKGDEYLQMSTRFKCESAEFKHSPCLDHY